MGKCPKCDKDLEFVNVFTLEENKQIAEIISKGSLKGYLGYGNKEPVECSAKKTTIECPYCSKVLLSMRGDGDEERIKQLLM